LGKLREHSSINLFVGVCETGGCVLEIKDGHQNANTSMFSKETKKREKREKKNTALTRLL
jgi:hypothetical protein